MAKGRSRGGRVAESQACSVKRKRDSRNRTGRVQVRTGRVQVRTGRVQVQVRTGRVQIRTGRSQKTLRSLNIQRPWARLLLAGKKSVTVRKYPLNNYKDEDLWMQETRGNDRALSRDFKSEIIGTVRFGDDFEYRDLDEFRADEGRHCIAEGSAYDWNTENTPRLYGWVVASVCRSRPVMPPKTKGMVGGKATCRRATFSDRP